MSQFKGKKPTVKELNAKIAELTQTINEMNNDITYLAEALEKEQSTVRVPKELTVTQYNSLIDHLNKNRPEPAYPAKVPEKVLEPAAPGEPETTAE